MACAWALDIEDVDLSPAMPGDVPFLHALFMANKREEFVGSHIPEHMLGVMLEQQYAAQKQEFGANWPDATDLIVVKEAVKVGRVLISVRDKSARVIDLAILPEHQGLGIGASVMTGLCMAARDRTAHVSLRALGGGRAERFYARLGFEVTGCEAPYVEMKWEARD